MCGIGSIVGGDLRLDQRETAALRLQSALQHRGPDDRAIFSDGTTTLVHTRLAILDPTGAGRQPMSRGPLTITFNGEIYHFRERREELLRQGVSFVTGTDTEVLLALHRRHGEACLPLLRGMFAFAIWDEVQQTCFLARDPFGIKPLYYAEISGGGLVFASELRAILASGLVERRINPKGLHGFLATGSVPEPHTIVAGIRCLEAGHSLTWRADGMTIRRYFEIGFDPPDNSTPTGDLREALTDAVKHHLVSDVPVGLLLSGGIDSSALLALIRNCGHDDIATFSLGVEDAALDESGAARDLARHFGVRHHEMLLTQELARHWIGDFLAAIDQPTLDGFNTYCACKLAGNHGYKVVLSGLGADELFGGYPSFTHIPRLLAAGRILGPVGLRPVAHALATVGPQARWGRACAYLGGAASVPRAYAAFRGIFTNAEIDAIRDALLPGVPDAAPEDDDQVAIDGTASLPDEISRLELTRYLRNQLLRDADVMSMAQGVELRVPLLDIPLFSALRRVPAARRLQARKQLLRDLVPELPIALLAPDKRGFGLPFASWLRDEWADLADELPPLRRVALDPWYRRWALLVLTRWLRRHELLPA